MDVIEKEVEGLSRTYEVKVASSDLIEQLDKRIEEIRPQARLKGFRPGKVPASHIRKLFGRSMIDEIIQDTLASSSQKALDERELRPAAQPEIEVSSDVEAVAKGEADLAFQLRVELMPEFEPVEPKTLKIVRPVAEVEEEQIDAALENIATDQTIYEDKGEDAKAEEGDAVLSDFVGRVDGEEFEGGAAEDAEIVIGAGRLLPGFEDQLIGAAAGASVEVTVEFPEDYPREDLQGKTGVFDVTVKEVRAPSTPDIDDALAEKIGFEDLEKLKTAVRENLERELTRQSRMRAKRRLLDALDEAHAFDLPERMVEAEFAQIWTEVSADMERGALGEEDKDKSEDELKSEYRQIAERRVRLGLVLAEIGRAGGVEVSEEELAGAISAEARRLPGQEAQVVRYFQENVQARAALRAPIYEEKVVDYILELAEVSEETVTRDELFTEEE
ncbi:MAG: trigger factor [Caulobacterales bacterium]|nr:trigger factor [Caulobacterales bacterium]